jgi:hypothetical protein
MTRTVLMGLVVALSPLPHSLAAQTATDAGVAVSRDDTTQAALLAALHSAAEANRIVRFTSLSGQEAAGRVGYISERVARVGTKPLDLADQARLEVRLENSDPVWNGAVIGAIAGIPLGYVSYAAASTIGDQPYRGRDEALALVGGAAMGAVIGMVVDAAVEGPPSWRRVWHRVSR